MSLVENIRKKKKRIKNGSNEKMNTKKNSTVSKSAYADMKNKWGKK